MNSQELGYSVEWIMIRFQHSHDLLQQVDTILLGETDHMWEQERDLLPEKKTTGHQ